MTMKGNNTMLLNGATMIEVVQFWLNSQFKPGHAPTVRNVSVCKNDIRSFDVSLAEPPSPTDEATNESER